MMRKCHIILLMVACMHVSCIQKNNRKAETFVPSEPDVVVLVDTMSLHKTTFNDQLLCNGRLYAKHKCLIRVPANGIVEQIFVRNGYKVKKGDLLASLNKRDKLRERERCYYELERAKLALQDKLIGMGYDTDTSLVPKEVYRQVEIASGYYAASYQLKSAELSLEECDIRAPFNGLIADLEARPNQNNERLCTLIDNSSFDVEFNVLESEMNRIYLGGRVIVRTFADKNIIGFGQIVGINPRVSEFGQIKVTASIKNADDKWMDGMNVRVVVENTIEDVFVVPKSAVAERDGYYVVFLYSDGCSLWTYVDILHENLSEYVIEGNKEKASILNEGASLILSGVQNLADDTQVKPK